MSVPRQQIDLDAPVVKGPRARTRKLMLSVASQMMRDGASPSVSEVAARAEVSRSTAYRYFPTRAAMVRAVVGENLGPILEWQSESTDPGERMESLIRETFRRISENEATFRAALRLSLEQQDDENPVDDKDYARGHRIELLGRALAPLRDTCSAAELERLSQALSMVFGIEGMIVLKDIWNTQGEAAENVAVWTARALINATIAESR